MAKRPRSERSRWVDLYIDPETWEWATREAAKNRMGQREFMAKFLNLSALALEEQDDAGQEV